MGWATLALVDRLAATHRNKRLEQRPGAGEAVRTAAMLRLVVQQFQVSQLPLVVRGRHSVSIQSSNVCVT